VCDIFILGQTLTTDVADSGSRALGDVHADVKDDVVRSVCDFVAEMLNSQWVNTLISLNYGEPNPQEVPELVPDIEDPVDEIAMAQRDLILINQIGMEVPKDWLFKRHRVPETKDASEVFKPVTPPNPLAHASNAARG
jgi:phage gp29-like protein